MDFRLIIFSIIFSFLIITSTAYAQVLNSDSLQKSVKVEIDSIGAIHVTHVIKRSGEPHPIDLIMGTMTNLTVKDPKSNDLQYGIIDENTFMIFPSKDDVIIEYDLSNVLTFENNFWLWDFLYLESTSFYFPEGVDLVFVDDKPAFIGDKKGIICHGCQMKLEYSLNEPKFLREVIVPDEKYLIEFRTWDEVTNFNFNKDLGRINFKVNEDYSFVTTAIPMNLISGPYSVLLDNQKILFHKFNENGTHIWLNMRPQHSGEISVLGTVIPDFSNDNPNQLGELSIEYLAVIVVGIGVLIAVIIFKRKK